MLYSVAEKLHSLYVVFRSGETINFLVFFYWWTYTSGHLMPSSFKHDSLIFELGIVPTLWYLFFHFISKLFISYLLEM